MDKNITLVSAFYIFKSKFPVSKYEQWIINFMKIKSNKLIFTNRETLSLIQKHDITKNTKYEIIEIPDFYTSKFDSYWNYHNQIDHEKYHTVNLYKIWAEKSEFLKKAININPFSTDYFVWCDIGCFRDPNRMDFFKFWPKSNKIKDKVIFLQLRQFTENEKQNIQSIDERFRHVVRIGGGIIAGHKDKLLIWHQKYFQTLNKFFEKKVFAGKDQNVYAFTILQNPGLVELICVPNDYKHDEWFYLEDYLN